MLIREEPMAYLGGLGFFTAFLDGLTNSKQFGRVKLDKSSGIQLSVLDSGVCSCKHIPWEWPKLLEARSDAFLT
eukprot:scaffold2418_cov171-Pinguiococcus_pyrenoidosus.AAC.1